MGVEVDGQVVEAISVCRAENPQQRLLWREPVWEMDADILWVHISGYDTHSLYPLSLIDLQPKAHASPASGNKVYDTWSNICVVLFQLARKVRSLLVTVNINAQAWTGFPWFWAILITCLPLPYFHSATILCSLATIRLQQGAGCGPVRGAETILLLPFGGV